MWCVSHLPKGAHAPAHSWHDDEQAADVAAWRLRFGGLSNVIVWFDSGAVA